MSEKISAFVCILFQVGSSLIMSVPCAARYIDLKDNPELGKDQYVEHFRLAYSVQLI